MNKSLFAFLAILTITPVYADDDHGHRRGHGGEHHGSWGWEGWIVPTLIGGAIVYGLTQPQPAVQPQPVYVQPQPEVAPVPNQYWYFCSEADAYYPYVSSCPGGWKAVLATPHATEPGDTGDAPAQ